MKYLIKRASNIYCEENDKPCDGAEFLGFRNDMYLYTIEISSLQELHKLCEKEGCGMIIELLSKEDKEIVSDCAGVLTIYDSWLE